MCAGSKINKKKQTFFTYSGKGKEMKFKHLGKKSSKNAKKTKKKWKPAHMSKVREAGKKENQEDLGKPSCTNSAVF